jgi:hypothetical protein
VAERRRRRRSSDDVEPVGPPVRRTETGFVLDLGADDRAFVVRLLGELRDLLVADEDPALGRLFPPAFPDDAEHEAEYQRLMRDELVASRLAAIAAAVEVLDRTPDEPDEGAQAIALTEPELHAFVQALNAARIVLGTLLGITDEASAARSDERAESGGSSNDVLYGYLGWLVEWTVRALAPPSP